MQFCIKAFIATEHKHKHKDKQLELPHIPLITKSETTENASLLLEESIRK